MTTKSGFIKDYLGNILLPITRAELVKDKKGVCAFRSGEFLATEFLPGLMSPEEKAKLNGSGDDSLESLKGLINTIGECIQIKGTSVKLLESKLNITDSEQIETSVSEGTLKFKLADTLPLKSATLAVVSNTDTSLVNRQWVSKQIEDSFKDAIQISTGSLRFKGLLTTSVSASDLGNHTVGDYYKISGSDVKVDNIAVKNGDTVLVADNNGSKYWCVIPSGDEIQTTLTAANKALLGNINITSQTQALTISSEKNLNDVGGTITFALANASLNSGSVVPGMFSQQIYDDLTSQITSGITYTSLLQSGLKIGTLGTYPLVIPTVVVKTVDNQPVIKYNGIQNDGITMDSGDGITVTKESDTKLKTSIRINTESQLKFTNGVLDINVWKSTDTDNPNGLVTFDTLIKGVGDNVMFVTVGNYNELTDTEKSYLTL